MLVINLVFPPSTPPPSSSPSSHLPRESRSNLLHPDGFGYLVPRPPPSPIDIDTTGEQDRNGYLTQQDVDNRAKKQVETIGEVDLSHAILGTIFDSAICFPGEEQDIVLDKDDRDNEQAGSKTRGGERKGRETRMTIMLGGPHPLPEIVTSLFSPPAAANQSASLSSFRVSPIMSASTPKTEAKTLNDGDDAALNLFLPPLLRTLARTLSPSLKHRNLLTPRTFDEPFELGLPPPSYARAHYHRNCIPTYTPGHLKRMDELRAALGFSSSSSLADADAVETTSPWKGRMHVIGAGVGGVSLGDCVQQGRDVAFAIAREHKNPK